MNDERREAAPEMDAQQICTRLAQDCLFLHRLYAQATEENEDGAAELYSAGVEHCEAALAFAEDACALS